MKNTIRFTSALILLFAVINAFSQPSLVVLSSFRVIDVMTPSSGELNSFILEVTANDPLSLSRLEIILEENNKSGINTQSVYIPVAVKDGKAALIFGEYSVPFEGKHVRFSLKVRDQIKSPYQKISINGYDKINKETNQLEHNRIN